MLYFRVLVPSLLWSLDLSYPADYTFYLGYDDDDSYFADKVEAIRNYFDDLSGECPATQKVIVLDSKQTKNAPARAWNQLAAAAHYDGMDYLFQVNDDLEFVSRNWTRRCIETLQSFTPANVGVVGPTDEGNPRLLTQAFVHRTHLDIMGVFYPSSFRNWYSDDWIQQVYPPASTVRLEDFHVWNSNIGGTRYDIDTEAGARFLQHELAASRERLHAFLQNH